MIASATRITWQTRPRGRNVNGPPRLGAGTQKLRSDGSRQHPRRMTRQLRRPRANRPLPAARAGIVRHRSGIVCRLFPGAGRLAAGTGCSRRWDVDREMSGCLLECHPPREGLTFPVPCEWACDSATAVPVPPCPLTRSAVVSRVEGKRQADKQHAASGSRPLAPALARFSTGAVRPGGPPLAIRKGCSHGPHSCQSPARPGYL